MYDDFIGEQVTCARLSKDGHCNVVSVLANKVLLYDKSTGELLNEYAGHVNKSYQIENCMNNDLNEIISGSEDGYVYIWDLVDAKVKQKLKHSSDRTVHSLSYHPDHDKLMSAQEQYIYLWEKKIKI
jgi:mitogen-activated protein kinase organizer 1